MKFNPKSPVTSDYVELMQSLASAALSGNIPEFERLSAEHDEYHAGARAHAERNTIDPRFDAAHDETYKR